MSNRSLALFVAALTSAPVATAHAQSVYVAPGGVYVGAGPVYVIPAPPNGVPPYAAPGPAGAPAVVAPGAAGAPVVVAPSNGTQGYVVPGRVNGGPPYVAPGAAGAPVVVAPGTIAGPVAIAPAAGNGTRIYVVPAPADEAPLAAYGSAGRPHLTPPAPREPASAVRGRTQAPPRAYAAGQAPRPRAAVPYNGSDRCIIYGRREYCD
jgi:hypothetical protein